MFFAFGATFELDSRILLRAKSTEKAVDANHADAKWLTRAALLLVLASILTPGAALGADDALPHRADRKTGAPLPYEQMAGRVVEYASVVSARGHRVRTITTRPPAPGRLPVIVFIPWLSCDSAESPRGPTDGWSRMLHAVASGVDAVFVRVDKPGVGDSEGDCSRTTLEDDLAAYRAAIRAAIERTDVDPSRLTLFGGSIGGALAPLLAREFKAHVIVSVAGFSRTWGEHILAHERRRLTLSGSTPAQVNAALRGFVEFYALYLDSGMTPAQVVAQHPELKAIWYDAPEHQYGRHARYFQEVQAQNVEAAWDAVRIPTLVLWGEYDWIMGRADQERIVEIVNANTPGLAQLAIIPGMNHHFERFTTPLKAFREEGGTYAEDATALLVDWLRRNI
jgi:pimeloyl-ACP methyl ester carboxylesterase